MSRHIGRKHKDEPRVEEALKLPRKERIKRFDSFKNEGILKANLEEAGKENPHFQRNRECDNDQPPVYCSGCQKSLSAKCFERHKQSCLSNKPFRLDWELVQKAPNFEMCDQFKKYVIGTMRNDTIGMMCKQDEATLLFGVRLYDKVRKRDDNIMGTRKDVRAKMRSLTHLHSVFLSLTSNTKKLFNNVKDIFIVENFENLKKAIETYTSAGENNKIKSGLKVNLQFLLIKAAKIFKATAITEDCPNESAIFDNFLCVFDLWKV